MNVECVGKECLQGIKRSGRLCIDFQHRVVAEQVLRSGTCKKVHSYCADHGPVYVYVDLSGCISVCLCLKSQPHIMRERLILDAGIRYGECRRYVRKRAGFVVVKSIYVSSHADLGVSAHQFRFGDEACEVFCQDGLHVAAVDLDFGLDAGPALVQPYVGIGMERYCGYVGVEVLKRYCGDGILRE